MVSTGASDTDVARRTGLPRSTVRDMRRSARTEAGPRTLSSGEVCPRCWRVTRPVRAIESDYAELLAVYLGDGHIVRTGRAFRLCVFPDAKYPAIVDDVEALLGRCFPSNKVSCSSQYEGTMATLSVYCSHLPCLFPQFGPGRKHERDVSLEPWQQEIISVYPWPFIRGLIRTDGCSFTNRTGPYEYLSFGFANCSEIIINLMCQALEGVEVDYRRTFNPKRGIWHVRINRRASVERMVERIGVKA